MADDLGARLVPQASGPAEVVRVAVGHDDGVDAGHREAGLGEAGGQGAVGLGARQAGVDERDAASVLQGVAVDVAEAGHRDRQLQAQHARADLGDLLRGRLLLLAHRRAHPGRVLAHCK